jgi:predicted  nucleic acid-binding Zn-ribbon protein
MLDVIEKLLVLQDRDRKILQTKDELAHVDPERRELQGRASTSQARLDAGRLRAKQIESDRKKLELDVEAKKQQIEKYSLQQFQTKKNEEYRALANEIESCKKVITLIEDQELELMEKAEAVQKEVTAAQQVAADAKKLVDGKLGELETREKNLRTQLASLESNRAELASAVDDETRVKYERLLKSKGSNVVVGISHHSCGGCHMKLNRSTVVACQAQQEIVTCTNCGRILYFTRDMDLAIAD